jgi:hypothetical protein
MTQTNATRLLAIELLAQVGHMDFFDLVKDASKNKHLRPQSLQCLSFYGKDSRFHDQAKLTLETIIRDTSETYPEVAGAIIAMEQFDSNRSFALLEEVFRTSQNRKRLFSFEDLGLRDQDGQPERAIWALALENDEHVRDSYFPSSSAVLDGTRSRRYFDPFFIKFTKDLLVQESPSSFLAVSATQFLRDFHPLPPLSGTPTTILLDSLISLQTCLSAYGWLTDNSLVSELYVHLQASRGFLQAGDLINCARQMRIFQQMIDLVYKDSDNANPSKITLEAWKFLHYNAQYVLDRLPAIPPSPAVTSLNPATAYSGGNGFSLTLKGMAFVPTSVVLWNGSSHTTSFVADSMLQATILASDIASPGIVRVTVLNPGNDTSNVLSFTIKPPPPAVTALSPATAEVGSKTFTLAVSGSNFVFGAVVTWKGSPRITTFVSASLLRASILGTDVASVGSALVGVKNPDGSVSNTLTFTIIKTVSMLLADLRLQLSQSLTKGLIGDANFVKELDNGLDNAKKHLSKPDSVNCYKEVATFQDKVNKEYLRTADNDKKGIPRDKRFVTKDGWVLLYNAAQEIMDRLPSKK